MLIPKVVGGLTNKVAKVDLYRRRLATRTTCASRVMNGKQRIGEITSFNRELKTGPANRRPPLELI